MKAHLFRVRKEEIQNIALVDEDYMLDVYKEALAVQELRSVPVVGTAVDRRASLNTLEVYNDDRIHLLI